MINSRFISFEGGEGSGKSTQIKILAKKLSKKYKVVVTREPGGTPEAEKIRKLLVKDRGQKWSTVVEILLLYAARKDHIDRVILPNLKKGYWVLCDRYIDSTFAYQGIKKDVNIKLIKDLNKAIIGGLIPSLTFYLDIDPLIGLKRSKRRSNNETRYENLSIQYHKKIRSAFLKIAKKNKKRVKIIDGNHDKVAVSDNIWDKIKKIKDI